jgi:aryl carrier-like protein
VLGLDRIGVHDNFFDLGGTSIRLLAVLNALREREDSDVTLVDLFRLPTIAALADRLDRTAGGRDPVAGSGEWAARRRVRRANAAARQRERRGGA